VLWIEGLEMGGITG